MQFSTRSMPLAQRTASYVSALTDYFSVIDFSAEVTVHNAPAEGFAASLEQFAIGELSGAVHCCSSPHLLHAKPVATLDPSLDLYLVRSGNITFRDSNGDVDLLAGEMALVPADVEFSSQSESMELIALRIPDRVARDPTLASRWLLRRRIRGDAGLGACLVSLLSAATARHQELTRAAGAVLQSTVVNSILLLGLDADAPAETLRALSARQQEKLSQLKTLALRSLQDGSLTPAALAEQSGVSIRTIHRLFNGSGMTLRSWLRESRLQRCWMELTDAAPRRATIASVAFRWGFNDLQTFNRAFSARYGMTPQAACKLGQRGIMLSADTGCS
jgi:AraC-like DNA-binding protein